MKSLEEEIKKHIRKYDDDGVKTILEIVAEALGEEDKQKMKDSDKKELLEALLEKEAEAIIHAAERVTSGIEKAGKEYKAHWKAYQIGMSDAREVIEEFGRPTEDVMG